MEIALSQEDRDRIVALARGIRFNPRSLNVSSANVVRVLNAIADNAPLDDSFPIHSSMLFETEMSHVFWSCFGDMAPTCRFVGGPQIDLASSRNIPKHIGFRQIPLREALIDLDLMLSSKSFTNTSTNRRSGPYKDRIYTGLDATQILQALVRVVGGSVASDKQTKASSSGVNVSGNLFEDDF